MSINRRLQILHDLYTVIVQRSAHPSENSYVSRLLTKGKDSIHSKLLEETLEALAASQEAAREQIIHELADVWFHSLVLLGYWNISPDEILGELSRRWGRSGLTEKAERQSQ